MRRGTTPTLIFKVPMDPTTFTKLNIAFAQDGEVKVEKDLSDCVLSENEIQLELSEEDTLKFVSGRTVEIQLRVGIGALRYASTIIKTDMNKILKDGVL